jgi:HAE1 family hydrophobic/amphiphilic exporter-1
MGPSKSRVGDIDLSKFVQMKQSIHGVFMRYKYTCTAIAVFTLAATVSGQGIVQIVSQEPSRGGEPAIDHIARVGIDESRPLSLTLFDAVRMALEKNRDLEVERLNVQQAEYDLFAARGARDVGLSGNTYYDNRTVPVGSVLQGGANGSLTSKTFDYDFTAQQLLATGGQWSAQFINGRADTTSAFASLNPQYNTSLNLLFRQPLVRNFAIDDARRRIRIASRKLDQSDAQFRRRAIEIVARVQRAYWEMVFALRDLQVRRDSVTLARTQLEHNRRMVKEGTLAPIELVSVEVELERRSENVLAGIDAVTRAENSLKQLILDERQSGVWQQPLAPTDAPDTDDVALTLDGAMTAALSNRAELAQNDLQQEINNVDVKFFENQTRPQIDLIASYTSTGLSGTLLNSVNPFAATTVLLLDRVNVLSNLSGLPPIVTDPGGQLPGFLQGGYGQSLRNLFSNDFRSVRFGISFSFPLRNRTARAQLGRSLAEGRKVESQRKTLEQTIEAEVRNSLQTVETTRLRVETSRASREAAQKQLDSEQRRFDAGLSTNFLVLDRQNALSEARAREIRALTDYNKAVADLQQAMGTTLTSANVEVKPPTTNKR